MALAPYVISGIVKDSEDNVVADCNVFAYNVTKEGYMIGANGTTNALGQYQIDISDQTIVTNVDGYVNGDKLQLHFIKGNQSIMHRHTIAAGDGGAWSQNTNLHNGQDLCFIKDSDGLARTIERCSVSSIIVSNTTAATKRVWLYDKDNDNPVITIECPADNSKPYNLGNKSKRFSGGLGIVYEVITNDGTYNDLECDVNYGKSPI